MSILSRPQSPEICLDQHLDELRQLRLGPPELGAGLRGIRQL